MTIREAVSARIDYEQRRDNDRVVSWLRDSMITALSGDSSCRQLGF